MDGPHRMTGDAQVSNKQAESHVVEIGQNGGQQAPKVTLYERLLEQMWLFEFFALIVSLLAMIGMVLLLVFTNGKPPPVWEIRPPHTKPFAVTLNSVLSIFSTLVKSTVLIPVVASLGELKWLWFRKGRKLTDVQVYDGAAKGPLGALAMLWVFRAKTLACLGAIIIIGSLTLDFAFQQLVTYPLKPFDTLEGATIARTSGYNGEAPGALSSVRSAEPGMVAAVYRGLYAGNPNLTVTPNCPTGNCTWSTPYTSLGVCSLCTNVTSMIEKVCGNYTVLDYDGNPTGDPVPYCNYTLPGSPPSESGPKQIIPGVIPIISDPTLVSVADGAASNTSHFGDNLVAHIGSMSILRADWQLIFDENNTDYQYYKVTNINATECGLDFCAIKYSGVVNQSVFTETTLETFINTTASWGLEPNEDTPSVYISPPQSFSSGRDETFSVDPFTWRALGVMFQSQSETRPSLWAGTYNSSISSNAMTSSSDFISYLRFLDDAGINTTFASLAASMTTRMRNVPGDGTNLPSDPTNTGPTAQGTSTQLLPYVNVRWGWIALPASLLFLSASFLIVTVVMVKKKGGTMFWKANSLANFYHPLTSDGMEKLQSAGSAKEAEKIAQGLRVRWVEAEGRFVPA